MDEHRLTFIDEDADRLLDPTRDDIRETADGMKRTIEEHISDLDFTSKTKIVLFYPIQEGQNSDYPYDVKIDDRNIFRRPIRRLLKARLRSEGYRVKGDFVFDLQSRDFYSTGYLLRIKWGKRSRGLCSIL